MQTTQKATAVAWQSTHREHGGSDDGRSAAACYAPSVLQEANDLRRFISVYGLHFHYTFL